MITCVIFDLDGLLSDTEKLHMQAYQEAFAECGVAVSDGEYAEHWIKSGKTTVHYLSDHQLSIDLGTLRKRKAERYTELIDSAMKPMPGALNLVQRLKGVKRLCVASSSYGHDVRHVLERLGILDFFEKVVAGDDVEHIKPHPEIFLKSAGELAVSPRECVVLEDAEKGVVAAHRAGMKCIAVPNQYTKDNDFSKASVVLDSLDLVDVAMLESL